MAMTVANNNTAALTLGELNKNVNKLGKNLKKISTGAKINGGADGASEYAQSEKLRTLTRALEQDIENSQKGINLVKTAEDGIQGIVDSLRTMKELAINSLNGHNSDEDRKILQKEFSSRMATIEDLASTTNYNGIILLDGRWRQSSGEETVTHYIAETVTEYETLTEPYTEIVTTYKEETEEYTETETTYTEEEEEYTEIETTYTEETEEYTETEITYTEETEEYPYTYTVTKEKPLESHAVKPSAAVPTGVREPGIIYSGDQPLYINGQPVQATKIITVTSDFTIDVDGAYMIPENYTGKLHIEAKNVKLVRQNKSKPLYDVYIDTPSTGNMNLWLEDMDLIYTHNGATPAYDSEGNPCYVFNNSLIKFQGNNNILTIKGSNKIAFGDVTGSNMDYYEKALINVGKGLTIEGSGTLELHEGWYKPYFLNGALIGSDHGEVSTANITINSGTIITSADPTDAAHQSNNVPPYGDLYGAVIGAGRDGSIGNIIINGGTFDLFVSGGGACIGGGMDSTTGNITVQNASIKAQCDDGACIGSGCAGGDSTNVGSSSTGYIYILNSDLDLRNTELAHINWENPSGTGAAIGGGGTYEGATTTVGDITVDNSTVKAVTDRGAGIGTGGDTEYNGIGEPHAYGISVKNSTLDITVNDSRAEKIGKGVNGIIPLDEVEEEVTEMRTRTVKVPHETTVTKTRTVLVPHETTVTKTRKVLVPHETTVTKTRTVLVPHEETITSYRTHTIPHETTKMVEYQEKLNIKRNPLVIHTGPRANQNLWLHINDMRTKAMGLEDAAVDPLEKAREALEKLDSAVEYALNENTRMGAYQMRLTETIENLVARLENTISSESVIRDADMAKEMMNYTKNNILKQVAQAMLSQANQSAGGVLSLLQ